MKILLIMDPGIPVPPIGYGGHERLVEMFAKEYTRLGHEVHLLVGPGSSVDGCQMIIYGDTGFPLKRIAAIKAIQQAWVYLWKHRQVYDLIHNFGRLVYLLPILNNRVKKIMTYGREISQRNIGLVNRLPNKNIVFTGCSDNLVTRRKLTGKWQTVYNAIDFNKYDLVEHIDQNAPLIFLGRLEKIKGCHTAIAICKQLGCKLVIAGNISTLEDEARYFETHIKPHIDGNNIKYVGQLNDKEKNKYLGTARALLFPIEWNEPFGMVMVEAMACGTPVVGFNRGSVPEVIDEGLTGFKVNTIAEMIEKVNIIKSINRRGCRSKAQQRFNVDVIAEKYLTLFNA